MFLRAAFGLALGVVLSGAALAAPPPKVGITSFAELKTPLPYPYDEAATAAQVDAAVAQARARAAKTGKLLVIDLGGNWCADCRILTGTLERPDVKPWLDSSFELVTVDVGRFNKNLQVPAAYGITHRLEGVPALLVVEPKTNRLLSGGHEAALADARYMTPQALVDWLAQWTK